MHIDKPNGYFGHLFKIQDIAKQGAWQYAPLLSALFGVLFGYVYAVVNANYKSPILKAAQKKFYFDETYNNLIVKSTKNIALIITLFEKYVIDKLGPKGSVLILDVLSKKVSKCHNGYIFSYSLWILFSLLIITTCLVINIF
jgi:NADH:ubiquinone oxidoreductase subunit 5 (subunit L)/multisubunit Na+/H+ antiporter MnhA subunit